MIFERRGGACNALHAEAGGACGGEKNHKKKVNKLKQQKRPSFLSTTQKNSNLVEVPPPVNTPHPASSEKQFSELLLLHFLLHIQQDVSERMCHWR